MVYSILYIFFAMNMAEQQTIIDKACNMPNIKYESQTYDNRLGMLTEYEDGSSIMINHYSTMVRNPDGLEVYYKEYK